MRDRPFILTLITWYLIITSSLALAWSFDLLNSHAMQERMHAGPLPYSFMVFRFFATMAIPLVTAIFMFEGAHWARVVYFAWGCFSFSTDAILNDNPWNLIIGLPIFIAISVVLFLPRLTLYFRLPQHYS